MSLSPTFVGSWGSPNAPIAIVGEQPGNQEVVQQRPFVGPAGENLHECLHTAGISSSLCYFTNVIKDLDHSLDHYIVSTRGTKRKPPSASWTEKGQFYLDYLESELNDCSSNVIVVCGNVALWALCERWGIHSWRGSVLESTLLPGRKVLATLHPANWTWEKLRKNPKAYFDKYLVGFDLKKALRESKFPDIIGEKIHTEVLHSYYDVLDIIREMHERGLGGDIIYWDIELETSSQELSCISLGYKSDGTAYAFCIPFIDASGDTWSPEQEATIMRGLSYLLHDEKVSKGGQYIVFDSHFLLHKYGIPTHNLRDTFVAQGILYPDFPKGLDFITSMWTNLPYYKRDGKIWLEGSGSWEQGWQYNCLDSISCAVAHPKQINALKTKANLAAYERQVKLIEPLVYMMERGIKVDYNKLKELRAISTEKIEELEDQIYSLMGKEINLNSSQQLQEYFYIEKRLPPYINPKTDAITVDEDALKRIARKGFPEAQLILELRHHNKRLTTYLTDKKFDPDGRIRCQFNPSGTKFSRISSSENIFGRGTNLQNWPHELLSILVADSGYVIYRLDMSQFENRVVAYVGNIRPLIEAFENGLDTHRLTGSLMSKHILGYHVPYEEVGLELRQDGKRGNHSFGYGRGYRAFALDYGITDREGKIVYDAYHAVYPGIKNSYWTFVQQELQRDRTLTNLLGRKHQFLGQWNTNMLNEAYSCIPQSTCGDLINERGLIYTYYNQQMFAPVELLIQIHDDIGFQIPLSLPIREHARIILDMRKSLEKPLQFRSREFVPPADLSISFTMNKDDGIDLKGSKFPYNVDELEKELDGIINVLQGSLFV
jgi:uracil-DNA glycosylase family 4